MVSKKTIFKLMNNSVFGENNGKHVRKRCNVEGIFDYHDPTNIEEA